MLAFFRYIRSELGSIIVISSGFSSATGFFIGSSNSTVMMSAVWVTIALTAVTTCAFLCKIAQKGMIALFFAAIPMPFLSAMAISNTLQFSLEFHQQTVSLREIASIQHTLLIITTFNMGNAFALAAFCLPTSKKPPSRSKQDVLRRGAKIVLFVSVALIALPLFDTVQRIGIGQ